MSKFLTFWISLILVIFFTIPTSAYALNSSGTYTYYVTVASRSKWRTVMTGTRNSYLADRSFKPVFDAISSQYPAGSTPTQVTIQSFISYITKLDYYFDEPPFITYPSPRDINPASLVQFDVEFGSGGKLISSTNLPYTLVYNDPMHSMEYDVFEVSAFFDFDSQKNLIPYGATIAADVVYIMVVTTSFPLDLSGLEGVISSGLLSISSDLTAIKDSINLLLSAVQGGFTSLDSRLLAIINAINSGASSGGGTAAIVGAISSATGQINKVLAQQQVSSDSIVGAIGSQTTSINAALGLVQSTVSGVTEELKRQAQANLDSVQTDGNKVTGMASDLLDQVNDKWSALTVPIDFTKKIFEVFTNGTRSASYRRIYGHISGYRYDSTTGGLEPIYTMQERAIGGTVITFPAFDFSLPGVGTLHVWDSYDFDLAQLKSDFPVIFDAIYLISGILMIYWIVDFIIHLADDLLDI